MPGNPDARVAAGAGDGPGEQALRGLRIADLTIITAGANATQMLADLGAEVVKVESGRYPDPFRFWQGPAGPPADAPPDPWNWSAMFNVVNRNKFGICLDLKHPRGREVFLRLVGVSDAVAENFRQGVLDRLGLGYDVLRGANPRIILLSLASQGSTGPESGYRSYGSTLDALSGLMSLTGYADSHPVWSGQEVNYPDQVASVFGAGLLLAAVRYRNRTGQGCHVDLSQRELVTTMIGEHVLEYTIGKTPPHPRANRHPGMAPHGCFPCRGEDAWVAISVESDAQWRALCETIGRPDLAGDERYRTVPDRRRHESALEQVIAGWTRHRSKHEAMRILQAAGVPAGAVQTGQDMLSDPHLASRRFYATVDNVRAGRQQLRVSPYRMSATPPTVRRPAPTLGQDTEAILGTLLGYSPDEIRELERLGVTANTVGVSR
jgi:crotonobetainyl-CoA:carnitine CoA-transferase CaiB-like acyl-CoA transferase